MIKASSFADPKDVAAFRKCKSAGNSDEHCFGVGDNGVGCWGDDCTEGTGPSCAVPPEYMVNRWGSMHDAKHKQVLVQANKQSVVCILKDVMPHIRHITNGARIDLNPDAVRALGLEPPILIDASWDWQDDMETT